MTTLLSQERVSAQPSRPRRNFATNRVLEVYLVERNQWLPRPIVNPEHPSISPSIRAFNYCYFSLFNINLLLPIDTRHTTYMYNGWYVRVVFRERECSPTLQFGCCHTGAINILWHGWLIFISLNKILPPSMSLLCYRVPSPNTRSLWRWRQDAFPVFSDPSSLSSSPIRLSSTPIQFLAY